MSAPTYTRCIDCKQPFSEANTHSSAGWRETQISGMCEDCFDALMDSCECPDDHKEEEAF